MTIQELHQKLTKEEKSLLLYIETRAVDHGGLIDNRHIDAALAEIRTKGDPRSPVVNIG